MEPLDPPGVEVVRSRPLFSSHPHEAINFQLGIVLIAVLAARCFMLLRCPQSSPGVFDNWFYVLLLCALLCASIASSINNTEAHSTPAPRWPRGGSRQNNSRVCLWSGGREWLTVASRGREFLRTIVTGYRFRLTTSFRTVADVRDLFGPGAYHLSSHALNQPTYKVLTLFFVVQREKDFL